MLKSIFEHKVYTWLDNVNQLFSFGMFVSQGRGPGWHLQNETSIRATRKSGSILKPAHSSFFSSFSLLYIDVYIFIRIPVCIYVYIFFFTIGVILTTQWYSNIVE